MPNDPLKNTGLNAQICEQARLSRDVRFDGKFFTAVLTTGIFCRPVCPARPPKSENVTYYQSATQAQAAGYIPCKRCKPELAPEPQLPVQVKQLCAQLSDGAPLNEIARAFELSERQIRRIFQQHYGIAPNKYVQQQRLLNASKLLKATNLSVSTICFAAGFSSIRRFNEAFKHAYGVNPSGLRKQQQQDSTAAVSILLHYRPPFDWPLMLSFFRLRQIRSIERVTTDSYSRLIDLENCHGWLQISHCPMKSALKLTVKLSDYSQLNQVILRVRRMFDLDADMPIIHQQLSQHDKLATVIQQYPGLRLPGCWDSFEFSIRAILGQQVSVKAATTLADRIVKTYGQQAPENPDQLSHYFPTPSQLADANFNTIGLTQSRISTLQNWLSFYLEQSQLLSCYLSVEQLEQQLSAIKGIGPWTVNYLAMRGLSEPDAFPYADLGIIKALSTDEQRLKPKEILALGEQWRPWRSYAAIYLWQSLA